MAAVFGYLPATESNGPFALGVRADLILRFGRTVADGAIRAGDPSEPPRSELGLELVWLRVEGRVVKKGILF